MWDRRKGTNWDTITTSRVEEGLGIKDFLCMDEITAIQEVILLLVEGGSLWQLSMGRRYVKNCGISEI